MIAHATLRHSFAKLVITAITPVNMNLHIFVLESDCGHQQAKAYVPWECASKLEQSSSLREGATSGMRTSTNKNAACSLCSTVHYSTCSTNLKSRRSGLLISVLWIVNCVRNPGNVERVAPRWQ